MAGPLKGVRVIEFAGLGPGPLCGMLLSDLGAEVVRIERFGVPPAPASHVYNRGRKTVSLNLKDPAGLAACLELCDRADILFEGYRPGVMERLGLGPDTLLARNPRLVYGRMTGWGQSGPLADRAGHDINYIALTGALHAVGTAEKPVPPLSLVGDFGGGAMFLVLGLVSALLHAREHGSGQVIDAAMSDGANYLMGMTLALHAAGEWVDRRASNIVDGGAPFFDTYECADGKWLAVGAIEPEFCAELISGLEISEQEFGQQYEQSRWPSQKKLIAERIRSKGRDEWLAHFGERDACIAPVLSLSEVPGHPHNLHRQSHRRIDGQLHPAPAPRFSHTPTEIQAGKRLSVEDVLRGWNRTAGEDKRNEPSGGEG